jgi:hypothetical protein
MDQFLVAALRATITSASTQKKFVDQCGLSSPQVSQFLTDPGTFKATQSSSYKKTLETVSKRLTDESTGITRNLLDSFHQVSDNPSSKALQSLLESICNRIVPLVVFAAKEGKAATTSQGAVNAAARHARVLEDSAIVLLVAIWQSFCEQITAEALAAIIHAAPKFADVAALLETALKVKDTEKKDGVEEKKDMPLKKVIEILTLVAGSGGKICYPSWRPSILATILNSTLYPFKMFV